MSNNRGIIADYSRKIQSLDQSKYRQPAPPNVSSIGQSKFMRQHCYGATVFDGTVLVTVGRALERMLQSRIGAVIDT